MWDLKIAKTCYLFVFEVKMFESVVSNQVKKVILRCSADAIARDIIPVPLLERTFSVCCGTAWKEEFFNIQILREIRCT